MTTAPAPPARAGSGASAAPSRLRYLRRLLALARPGAGAGGLLGDPHGLPDRLAALVASHDGIARTTAGPLSVVVVADPGLARTLLTLPTGTRKGRGIDVLRTLLGEGLLTSEGELHRAQRRLVQPAFHPARLEAYARDAVRAAGECADRWHDGRVVDLAHEMSTLTLDVVGRTLFGSDLRGDADEVGRAVTELLATFPRLMRPYGFLALSLPTPTARRIRRAAERLDAVVHRMVAAHRASGDTGDVLSLLLAARDEESGAPMPDSRVRDEVLTLLLAGHETTAVALSWTWFELSRHPHERAQLLAELDSATGREALERGRWEQLHRARAVVAETMRLHPPAYMMGRRVTAPLELGGHHLAPDTLCVVSPYGLHRDPRSWPEPLQWRPSRWLDAAGRFDEAAPGHPRGAYVPFGAGARICIGAAFATMEAVLLLGVLAARWEATVPEGFDPGLEPAVTLRPRYGVTATLRRRSPAPGPVGSAGPGGPDGSAAPPAPVSRG